MIMTTRRSTRVFTDSTVTAVVQSDADDCSTTNKALTYSFFAIATVIGWISIIIQSIVWKDVLHKDVKIGCTTVFGIILLLISLPMFLLSDSRQLLDCGFGCVVISNDTAGNVTSADACNYANHSLSLAFIEFPFFMFWVW